MRLVYIVTIETDDKWVDAHPNYTPKYIRHLSECRISDSLHHDMAYEKVTIKEVPQDKE